jgi:hypothetical protein
MAIDKELTYELLMEKTEGGKCPVCELTAYRMNESFERFLYEGVNVPLIRVKIEKTNGFCNRHSHILASKGDPLSHAVLYHDLMNNVIKNIGKKSLPGHSGCIFCEQEKSNENDYTAAFLEFYANEKFRDRYNEGGLLCVPHLTKIINTRFANKKITAELLEKTLEKYRVLNGRLSEIKRKSDYRFTN